MAELAIDVLDAFGIARAHVVGLSMGGYCALQLGVQGGAHPQALLLCVGADAIVPTAVANSGPRRRSPSIKKLAAGNGRAII